MATFFSSRDSRDTLEEATRPSAPNPERVSRPTETRQKEAVEQLKARLGEDRVTRIALNFLDKWMGVHLKDGVIDWMHGRRIGMCGHEAVNFGSDSFLGFDQDARVQAAIVDGMREWGTHNGASRAFGNIALCEEAERRLASWMGVEDTLIYPSVTLANIGLLPALAGKGDLLVLDRKSHDSLHQSARIAEGNGAKVVILDPCNGVALRQILEAEDYEGCVVAVDGIYSMTGEMPPLGELDEVTRAHGGILYVDDAHGTGLVGPKGRGAASMLLDSLDNALVVGSLSKAFSCLGAFVTCDAKLKRILKIRSSTFIFGGPVPPPYLAGICKVCDILESPEHDEHLRRLRQMVDQLISGIRGLGLKMYGGEAAIIAVTIGDIEQTFKAGKALFDRGYYVQSATYPAVPIMGGVLRIQVNANHTPEDIAGLLKGLAELKSKFGLGGN
ncbi:MAG: pyridoxal phosphate-dependent aminotransferase family protein [Planctomycetota bacterium]|nr:pyridoxal phosphate-dependent aminotransferase family protein [Planctomycetota bacterium]